MDPANGSDANVYSNESIRNSTQAVLGTFKTIAPIAIRIFYPIIASVGIVGNLLVIVVILSFATMKKWFTNILILNQSAVDLVASGLMLMLAVRPTARIPEHRLERVADQLICRLWYKTSPLWGVLVASSYNLIAIACERYFAVVHPIIYRNVYTARRAKLVCLVPWLMVVLFIGIATGVYDGRCVSIGSTYSTEAGKLFNGMCSTFIVFVLPTAIFVFCYTSMYRSLRRVVAVDPSAPPCGSQANRRENQMNRIRQNILTTQVTVVTIFVVCWTLNQVIFCAFNFGYRVDFTGSLYHTSVVLVFINCAANPFIYAAKYEMFQRGLRNLFCRFRQTTHDEEEMRETGTTTSTIKTGTDGVKF